MEKKFFTIDGNTARQALMEELDLPVSGNVLPVPEVSEQQAQIPAPERDPKVGRAIRRNRRNIAYLTPGYMAFLGVMVAILFIAVVMVVSASGQITKAEKQLASMTSQLNTIKSDNNAARVNLEKNVDINEVYEIAVGEYGLVYPAEEQIIHYQQKEGSYVVQNEPIPRD
ncbi:MAG: hypothetical protein J5865_06955 [Lachnospiraceae bacterium]|nr:hypothetical protein [Lachnospiraceae bacterium]